MTWNGTIQAAALGFACLAVGFGVGRERGLASRDAVLVPAAQQQGRGGAAPDSYQFFDTLVDLRAQISQNYVEKVNEDKLRNGAIRGMMAELDPYSNYFTKEELAAFDRSVHGQFSGIGAEIAQDPSNGAFLIVSPLEDSPALKAGVLAGDRILRLNGDVVDGLTLTELLTRVGGEPNSELKLTVLHEGEKVPAQLTVIRQTIQLHSVRGVKHTDDGGWDFMLDAEHRIAYVRISSFMENTADELDAALKPLIDNKANGSLKGIIVDLRFNPGGFLKAGIEVSQRFLDSGVIVSAGRPDSPRKELIAEANKEHTYPRVPLVVLINEYSASASEIVAGALKDHHRAVLIGGRTFGKGSVQSLINLENGNAALKLTTQYYYLPSGKNITRKKDSTEWGVEPDAAFNIPLTDEENRAVLLARRGSEIIHRKAATTAVAGDGAATQPVATTAPATGPATGPADGAKPSVEAADRQLQRGLEILIAYQSFGASAIPGEVTTTRPGVSASVPETNPATPATPPATAPMAAPKLPTFPDVIE